MAVTSNNQFTADRNEINRFNNMKSNIYNVGLSDANISLA